MNKLCELKIEELFKIYEREFNSNLGLENYNNDITVIKLIMKKLRAKRGLAVDISCSEKASLLDKINVNGFDEETINKWFEQEETKRDIMEEELDQYYSAAGFSQFDIKVLANKSDEEIKEMYEGLFNVEEY